MAANPLRQLPDEYLACRDLRHAWEELGYYRERGNRGAIVRKLQCLRCGTLRRDTLSSSYSEKTTHYYGHPDGYRIEGQGRAGMDEVRKEVVKRHQVITLSRDDLHEELQAD